MKLYGITGWKNAGKTGLMERLVTEITQRGFTVSTLKHAHHTFDVDHPGTDSFRHRAAGAQQVLLASDRRWALMSELREVPLQALLAKLDPADLVLIEGWKHEPHPKIEAWRAGEGHPLMARDDPSIQAVASDTGLKLDRPVFDLNDTGGIADFILHQVGLSGGPPFTRVIAVDWSARGKPSPARPTKDSIFICDTKVGGYQTTTYHRTRHDAVLHIETLLQDAIEQGDRVCLGFDFAFGYPVGVCKGPDGDAHGLVSLAMDGRSCARQRRQHKQPLRRGRADQSDVWGRGAILGTTRHP